MRNTIEHAWNIWATQRFLRSFASVSSQHSGGTPVEKSKQYELYLLQARINTSVSASVHTLVRVNSSIAAANDAKLSIWKPLSIEPLKGALSSNSVVLCCAVLCCAVLCCAVLCCAVLCCVVCIVLYVLCCMYCVVLCCVVLYCVALCCAVM